MYKPIKTEANVLRRYDADRLLHVISRVSTWRRKDIKGFTEALAKANLNYQGTFRDFQLAFVAKLVLYSYDKKRLSRKQFNWKDLLQICSTLTKHQDPDAYPITSAEDVQRFMIRLAYQQFPDFYGDNDTFARTRLLFRSCAKTVASKKPFDIDRAYLDGTGVTLDQSWDLTVALLGLILTENGGIQPGPIKAGYLRQNISESDIARFVDMISLTPKGFKQKLQQPRYHVDPHETFNPNPLVDWPLIRLDSNRWVVPVIPYLFRRGTEQVFYDVIEYKGREFSAFLGYVFEDYADRILSTLNPSYKIFSQLSYFRNDLRCDTCDKIIIKDGNAILIECKTKRLRLRTKFTADIELLRHDLTDVGKNSDKGNVVHAIRQLYQTRKDILANCKGLEELHRKITGKIYSLVLVLDPYYFVNAPYVKDIITEELEKGNPSAKGFSWQILDARGFEPLCTLSQHEDLFTLIAKKFSSAEFEVQDMKTFVDNYVISQGIDRNVLMHPVLSTELDIFWKEIEARYGINFKRGRSKQ